MFFGQTIRFLDREKYAIHRLFLPRCQTMASPSFTLRDMYSRSPLTTGGLRKITDMNKTRTTLHVQLSPRLFCSIGRSLDVALCIMVPQPPPLIFSPLSRLRSASLVVKVYRQVLQLENCTSCGACEPSQWKRMKGLNKACVNHSFGSAILQVAQVTCLQPTPQEGAPSFLHLPFSIHHSCAWRGRRVGASQASALGQFLPPAVIGLLSRIYQVLGSSKWNLWRSGWKSVKSSAK